MNAQLTDEFQRAFRTTSPRPSSEEDTQDPENYPPRSRLFIVCPKTSSARLIEAELAKYPDLQYVKTDLIEKKGVVFAKYALASSAMRALEAIQETGMLAGYRVKVMLADPKSKRMPSSPSPGHQVGALPDYMYGDAARLLGAQGRLSPKGLPGMSFPSLGSVGSDLGLAQSGLNFNVPASYSRHSYPNSVSTGNVLGGLQALQGDGSGLLGLQALGAQVGLSGLGLNTSPTGNVLPSNGMFSFPDSVTSAHLLSPHGSGTGQGMGLTLPPDSLSMRASPGLRESPDRSWIAGVHGTAQEDRCVVFSHLTRPLPPYALAHVFKQIGAVESVRLAAADQCFAVVRMASPELAQGAVDRLNGSMVLGETLSVFRTSPLGGMMSSMGGQQGLDPYSPLNT